MNQRPKPAASGWLLVFQHLSAARFGGLYAALYAPINGVNKMKYQCEHCPQSFEKQEECVEHESQCKRDKLLEDVPAKIKRLQNMCEEVWGGIHEIVNRFEDDSIFFTHPIKSLTLEAYDNLWKIQGYLCQKYGRSDADI